MNDNGINQETERNKMQGNIRRIIEGGEKRECGTKMEREAEEEEK